MICYITGLLGNFNDNQEDEFTNPDGVTLSQGSSATEEEIYNYGISCKFRMGHLTYWFICVNDVAWKISLNTISVIGQMYRILSILITVKSFTKCIFFFKIWILYWDIFCDHNAFNLTWYCVKLLTNCNEVPYINSRSICFFYDMTIVFFVFFGLFWSFF